MKRILLVDDDEPFRKMLRLTLVKLGYDVAEAANGRIAVKLHHASPADVVITDLIMPEQEGLETIMQLRRARSKVRIIAMSGGGRINARDFLGIATKFGADRTFTKPFPNQDLVAAIEELTPPPLDDENADTPALARSEELARGAVPPKTPVEVFRNAHAALS